MPRLCMMSRQISDMNYKPEPASQTRMLSTDRIAYSAIAERAPPKRPDGARMAV